MTDRHDITEQQIKFLYSFPHKWVLSKTFTDGILHIETAGSIYKVLADGQCHTQAKG